MAVRCFMAETHDDRQRPGAMWWVECGTRSDGSCVYRWGDCPGRHIHIRLPDGRVFAPDSRAANCGRPEDGHHRCWRTTGEPPNLSIVGSGCGSMFSIGAIPPRFPFHGWLRGGVLSDVSEGR